MATILAIDETGGSQNTSQGGVTANDTGNLTVPDLFDAALSAATAGTGATRIGVALSGFTGSGSGSTVLSFGAPVQDVSFLSSAEGAPVNGVDSGLKTLDGTIIYLYTSPLNNNVVLGRAGSATGDVVFALYLDTVDAGGTSVNTAGGGDAGATASKVWMAQYQPLQHIDALGTATIDESVVQFLTNKLYVGANSETSFDLTNAPSGQNLFLTVGDGSPATGEAAIVITGLSASDTVNTSQAGSNPIVVGTNNQMVVPGKGLYVSYVTLGDPDGNGPLPPDSEFTIPNLTSGEAGQASNIRFDAYLPSTGGGFTVVQTQPNNGPVKLLLAAFNETDGTEEGTSYFAGLTDGDEPSANITSVTITRGGTAYTASGSTGVLTLTNDNGTPGDTSDDLTLANVTKVKGKNVSTNVTVDFTGTTALITGLLASDEVDYVATTHNRVKITNAAASDGTAFDIGEFSIRAGSVTAQLLQDVAFVDDEPTLSFGNLVGTGTDLAQYGFWSKSDGADGANANELQVGLSGFQLGGATQSLANTTFSEGAFANGAYQYSGSLTGDFDKNASTPNTTITFTLAANPTTGKYALDLSAPVGSTTTTDTATGGLGAGGPDAVQTLFIPDQTAKGNNPPPPLQETVVFFSAKISDTTGSTIASKIIAGQPDPTEATLEADPQKGTYIDPRSMNVSTAGIGVDNNNLNGAGATGNAAVIDSTDESFVVNPGTLVDKVKVFIDNSVAAYDYAGGERLMYRIIYADNSVSGYTPVTPAMLTAGAKPNSPVSFVVDGAGAKIDAVQLTMAYGEIKIPNIQFITITEALANDISLDFTATLTDKDGDTATSNFSADLFTNKAASATFDYELLGSMNVRDAFDIDLASTRTDYQVTGFDVATDKLVFIGAGAGVGTPSASYDGVKSTVTVLEAAGGQTTSIQVVGVDLTQNNDYFVFA